MMRRRISTSLLVAVVAMSLAALGGALDLWTGASPARALASPSWQAEDVVSAKGVVVPHRTADLSFKSSGRVETLLVAEGDTVSPGQELARLETRDLEQAVLRAGAQLRAAQAELAKARAGARSEEVATAQAAVGIAETQVRSAEEAVRVAESNVEAAQAEVETAQGAVPVAEGNLKAAQSALASARSALDKLLAGATQREIQIAEKKAELAATELWAFQRKRDEDLHGFEGDIVVGEALLEIAQLELEQLKDPPRAEDVTMARAEVDLAQAGVQRRQAELAQTRTRVAQAEGGVAIAEASLLQAQAGVDTAQAEVGKARADLALVQAGSRDEDIAAAEAAVAEAEAVLGKAENALDDALLLAPFGGTIGVIFVDEGEVVSAYNPVMDVGDLSQLQVETEDLSEMDVDQVHLGQAATVTADALGSDAFPAEVVEIATLATDHLGDTVYVVTLDVGVGLESGLRWGMTTFVDILVQ